MESKIVCKVCGKEPHEIIVQIESGRFDKEENDR